jgi:hypothetical protein
VRSFIPGQVSPWSHSKLIVSSLLSGSAGPYPSALPSSHVLRGHTTRLYPCPADVARGSRHVNRRQHQPSARSGICRWCLRDAFSWKTPAEVSDHRLVATYRRASWLDRVFGPMTHMVVIGRWLPPLARMEASPENASPWIRCWISGKRMVLILAARSPSNNESSLSATPPFHREGTGQLPPLAPNSVV